MTCDRATRTSHERKTSYVIVALTLETRRNSIKCVSFSRHGVPTNARLLICNEKASINVCFVHAELQAFSKGKQQQLEKLSLEAQPVGLYGHWKLPHPAKQLQPSEQQLINENLSSQAEASSGGRVNTYKQHRSNRAFGL